MEKLAVAEFSRKIKDKYPAYETKNDLDLVERYLKKHPVYRKRVLMPEDIPTEPNPFNSDAVDNIPTERTPNVADNTDVNIGQPQQTYIPENTTVDVDNIPAPDPQESGGIYEEGTLKTRPGIPQNRLAATAVSAINEIPFVEIAGADVDQLRKDNPVDMMAGQIGSNVAMGFGGMAGASKVLAKTAIKNSPTLFKVMSRVVPALLQSGGQNAEEVMRGRKDIQDALFDTVIKSAGSAAFSVVPEIVMDPGAIQMIAQPLAGLMFQAYADGLAGEENLLSKEWFIEQIPSIAMDLGFSIADVGGGKRFISEQNASRAELSRFGDKVAKKIGFEAPEPPVAQKPVVEQPEIKSIDEAGFREAVQQTEKGQPLQANPLKSEQQLSQRTAEILKETDYLIKKKDSKETLVAEMGRENEKITAIGEDFKSTGLPNTKRAFQQYWKETTGENISRQESTDRLKMIDAQTIEQPKTEQPKISKPKDSAVPPKQTVKIPKQTSFNNNLESYIWGISKRRVARAKKRMEKIDKIVDGAEAGVEVPNVTKPKDSAVPPKQTVKIPKQTSFNNNLESYIWGISKRRVARAKKRMEKIDKIVDGAEAGVEVPNVTKPKDSAVPPKQTVKIPKQTSFNNNLESYIWGISKRRVARAKKRMEKIDKIVDGAEAGVEVPNVTKPKDSAVPPKQTVKIPKQTSFNNNLESYIWGISKRRVARAKKRMEKIDKIVDGAEAGVEVPNVTKPKDSAVPPKQTVKIPKQTSFNNNLESYIWGISKRRVARAKKRMEKIDKIVDGAEAGVEVPNVTKPKDLPNEKPIRKKGIMSESGSIGGKKQFKPEFKNGDASDMQDIFDKGDAEVKKKLGFSAKRFINKVRARVYDTNAPWKRAIAKDEGGKKVIMESDLAKGAPGEAKRVWQDTEKKIYDNIKHDEETAFNHFLQAKRSVEVLDLKGQEFKTPGGALNKEWVDNFKKEYPEKNLRFEKSADEYYYTIGEETVNKYVENGLTGKKAGAELLENHKHYSPRKVLNYVDPEIISHNESGTSASNPQSGIKRLDKGTEDALVNNHAMLLGQVLLRRETNIAQNTANKELYTYAKKDQKNSLGITFIKTPGTTELSAMFEGKRKKMYMPTEMAQYWVKQDPVIQKDLAKWLGILSGSTILKPMATSLNPGFAISNPPRDIIHSWFTTKEYNPFLPIGMGQMAKDIADVAGNVITRKGRVVDAIKEGGSMETLTQQGLLQKKPWETRTATRESVDQLQEIVGWMGNTSETLIRTAVRERAIKNGKSPKEATWIARNTIDFEQMGSWGAAGNKVVPFLNPAIQGTRGILRAFEENPVLATFKAAQIALVGAAFASWNQTMYPEAYNSVSEREKVGKFIITTPFSRTDKDGNKRYLYFAIAKDQGQRLFAMTGEAIADKILSGENSIEKLKMALTDLMPVDVGVSVPTLSAIWGYLYNKDFWRNQDYWRGSKEISPKLQINDETSPIAVAVGDKTGLSPAKLEGSFHKVFSKNLWTSMFGMGIEGIMAGATPEERNEISKPFYAKLAKTPLVNRIMRETWPKNKATESLIKKADKYDVDIYKKTGEPKLYNSLKREVRRASRIANDAKTINNRRFDLLAKTAIIGDTEAKAEFNKELKALKEIDRLEWRRVIRRLRSDFRENYKKIKQ